MCLFSAQAFAYPVVYTVDGAGSTPPSGQSPNYSFTTTFMVDTDQIGRQYVDGVEQNIPGSWFASILSFKDSAGNSFSFAPGDDTENGSYYAKQNVNSSGTEAYTYLRFAEDDLFKIDMVSSEFYTDWHLGTLFEINISSDILPNAGNFGRIVAISSAVPEPASLALILTGLGGLVATRRFKR